MICATDGPRGAELMLNGEIDCAIVNPETPDLNLPAVMEELREGATAPPPVIAYGREPVASVGSAVAHPAIPGVREIHSIERLLDQTVLALHIEEPRLKETHRKVLEDIHSSTKALAGRSVLIVDDDIRNIFALSSVLEDYGMQITTADNGRDAINIADKRELDVILMDIMMPELDGLDTDARDPQDPALQGPPIVAVTAKAMKGDRERCIEAGAWDYLSKPVDREQLLKVLRAWLR
jgi:CheY-like chemotaxis protein